MAIKVSQQLVTVYAPTHVSKIHIEQWLLSKKEWVAAQLHKQLNAIDVHQYPFKSQKVTVFAKPYTITFAKGTRSYVQQSDSEFIIYTSKRVKKQLEKRKQLLCLALEEMLTNYIEMRLAYYCQQMSEALPTKLTIGSYKRKWGSCNSRRELTFNLNLVGAPHHIIDYVIVHELAHLTHLNHSNAFWKRVAKFYPDYKLASAWLKNHGATLQWVFDN
ncbi:M48 family peptidase [Pseudoalteromonas sp. S3776]|uniref:M48 family metallopeptidase n=1 Tax=unclassified Pseudoalteromonas TaxID=194690 RepID=UPI0011097472|nr:MULTISPECIES: SprT family zinc-dependent metalloprotease [unclassified Pseudoalteromonas]TMO73181.1 M48 family peptidase [Pseudoalteromonas sp. S3785]TMO79342.1 M48 family peptidase [Pseudoalteromonas sp. S3776]